MSKTNYDLVHTKVRTFSGYKRSVGAMKAAGKWIDDMNRESPLGVTVLGIHFYRDQDGTCDVTVTLESS